MRLLTGLVFLGVALCGCGQNQQASTPAQPTEASATSKAIIDQAKQAHAAVAEQAAQVQAAVQPAADDLTAKIQGFLATAKQYLDSGKFNEAISAAQSALTVDPNNNEAKSIIETATTKIKAVGQQAAEDVKTNVLKALGK